MCDVLDVPRSTYYQSLDKTISNRDQENQKLTKRILELYHDSGKRYDAPKIHYHLNNEGYQVSLKRVQRLMKKANIRSIIVKTFRPTPSKEKVVERENILQRDFSTKTIYEKCVGDITYIHTLKHRSEERRVGKECKIRYGEDHCNTIRQIVMIRRQDR